MNRYIVCGREVHYLKAVISAKSEEEAKRMFLEGEYPISRLVEQEHDCYIVTDIIEAGPENLDD